jgi:drug/metabolite transporter (DMT)-like permease
MSTSTVSGASGPAVVICYRVLSGEQPAARTLGGVTVGFGGVAVLVAANGLDGSFPAWTMAVVLLAGLSWAFGSWLQPRLRLPRDRFVVVVYVNPLVAVLLGWLILAEPVTTPTLVGGAIVVGSVAMVVRSELMKGETGVPVEDKFAR